MSKILFDTELQELRPYPRSDDGEIVGLDPRYLVMEVVQEEKPVVAPGDGLRLQERIDQAELKVYRWWQSFTLPRFWPNSQAFVAAFTDEEKAAIALSTNQQITAMRLTLQTWQDTMHPDDERVSGGLSLLVSLGILTEQRKAEIIATATASI